MDIILVVVSFVMVFVNITKGQKCRPNYHHYGKENVCLTASVSQWSWGKARAWCRHNYADLPQVFDKDKEAFLKDVRNTIVGGEFKSWIGLSDMDMDGMFEFVNGTMLVSIDQFTFKINSQHVNTSKPGLGTWSGKAPQNPFLRQKQLCVVMGKFDEPWESVPCSESYMFYCEMSLKPVPPVKVEEAACTLEACSCREHNWKYYKGGDVYFTVNKIAENFSTSALICERLGGQLLKVPDKATTTFIRNMDVAWDPMGLRHWMGLHRRGNQTIWDDGTTLNSDDYSNWFSEPGTDSGDWCVSVIWDYMGKWRTEDCTLARYQVCQIYEPCSAIPALIIDGIQREDGAVLQKTHDQHSKVVCVSKGYAAIVEWVKVTCAVELDDVTNSDKRMATLIVPVNVTTHDKMCLCQLRLDDGTTKATTAIFYFKTRPRLVNDINNIVYYVPPGIDVVITVDLYANPRPRVLELMKDNTTVNSSEYKVTLEALETPLYYIATLEISKNLTNLTGFYTLPFENGIEGRLEFNFTLNIDLLESKLLGDIFVRNLVPTILMITTIFLILFVAYSARDKKKSDQDMEDSVNDQYAEERKEEDDESIRDKAKERSQADSPNTAPKSWYKSLLLG